MSPRGRAAAEVCAAPVATGDVLHGGEEGVAQRLGHGEPPLRLVDEHLGDQVEHVAPGVQLARARRRRSRALGDVPLERLAVLAHVAARGGLFVPHEPPALAREVLVRARLHGHPDGQGAEDALHHGQVLAVVVRLKESGNIILCRHSSCNGQGVFPKIFHPPEGTLSQDTCSLLQHVTE